MRQSWLLVVLSLLTNSVLARSLFTLGGVPLDLTMINPEGPTNSEQSAYGSQEQQPQDPYSQMGDGGQMGGQLNPRMRGPHQQMQQQEYAQQQQAAMMGGRMQGGNMRQPQRPGYNNRQQMMAGQQRQGLDGQQQMMGRQMQGYEGGGEEMYGQQMYAGGY